jgi:hypothetical protein
MGLTFAGLLLLPLAAWGSVPLVRGALNSAFGARTCDPESSAIGSCMSYAMAQTVYRRTDWDGDGRLTYAPRLAMLNAAPGRDGMPIRLIDASLAAATSPNSPKQGYCFREMQTIGGRPIDWEKDFALCAMPEEYGLVGRFTFIVGTDGRILGKDLGRAEFVADYPANPRAEGWRPEEECFVTPFLWRHGMAASLVSGLLVALAVWIGIAVYAWRRNRRKVESGAEV